MSSKAGSATSVRYHLFLEPRPESSMRNFFTIDNGYSIKVQRANGSAPRSVNISSTKENGAFSQSATFSMRHGSHVFELLIAKDVKKIPVTVVTQAKSKIFEWQAPFLRFPIEVEVNISNTLFIVLPEEQKEASSDSKEGSKTLESSAAVTVTKEDSKKSESSTAARES